MSIIPTYETNGYSTTILYMQTNTELYLNETTIREAKNVYRAINHNLRRQILELIHQRKKMTVTAIYRKLDIEQSLASQQLAILREAKIVNTERDRRHIYYSVNYVKIKDIHSISEKLLEKP